MHWVYFMPDTALGVPAHWGSERVKKCLISLKNGKNLIVTFLLTMEGDFYDRSL